MPQLQNAVCYRWADLPTDRPMDRLQRRRIIGEQAMISEVLLEEGCFVPTHAHENASNFRTSDRSFMRMVSA